MPWLRMVWRLGKLRLMRSHEGEYFLQWKGRQLMRLPRVRWPKLRWRHSTRRNRDAR